MTASPSTFTIIDKRASLGGFSQRDSEAKASTQAQRIARSLAWSDQQMRPIRAARLNQIFYYVGPDYGAERIDREQPLATVYNLIMSLAPALTIDPKAEVHSEVDELAGYAPLFAARINHEVKRLRLTELFRRIVIECLFGPAVVYVDSQVMGAAWDAGSGTALRAYSIPQDHWIPDMLAHHREELTYEAHRFILDRDWVDENKDIFKSGAIDELPLIHGRNDTPTSSHTDELQRAGEESNARWIDGMEAVCIEIQGRNGKPDRCVGLPGNLDGGRGFLWDIERKPGEDSRYACISLTPVIDNMIPLSPVGAILELHKMLNGIARKIGRRIRNMKDVLAYRKSKEAEAAGLLDTDDLTSVGVDDPKDYTTLSFGGNIKDLVLALGEYEKWENQEAGNPNAIGGIEEQAKTLGSNQMLFQNASNRIEYFREEIRRCIGQVLHVIGSHLWDEEDEVVRVSHRPEGLSEAMVHNWNQDEFPGEFEDYEIGVSPYGFSGDSPERRYGRITKWVSEVAIPLAASAAQQGYRVDFAKLIRITAEAAAIPGSDRLVQRALPSGGPAPSIQIGGDTINAGRAARPQLPSVDAENEAQEEGST